MHVEYFSHMNLADFPSFLILSAVCHISFQELAPSLTAAIRYQPFAFTTSICNLNTLI